MPEGGLIAHVSFAGLGKVAWLRVALVKRGFGLWVEVRDDSQRKGTAEAVPQFAENDLG